MSENTKVRSVLIWFTVCVSVVALGIYVFTVFAHRGNPVWNRALIAYCGVFWVFLAFDEFGRRAAEAGNERRRSASSRPRPVPQPNMPLPTSNVPPRSTDATEGVGSAVSTQAAISEVRLQRIDAGSEPAAQSLVDDCMREVLALEGKVYEHSPSFDVQTWLQDDAVFPFLIVRDGSTTGVAAIRREEASYRLVCMYVQPGDRRQHVGQEALKNILEFIKLLGLRDSLTVVASRHNMRAIKFCQSIGMATAKSGSTNDSSPTLLESGRAATDSSGVQADSGDTVTLVKEI